VTSLSFDGMAELYDDFRVVDDACLGATLDFIAARVPPDRCPRVFEPGIGNGRIAFPLAARGYRVDGVDISGKMLSQLEERIPERDPDRKIAFLQVDAAELPYASATFDWAIVVHLFWFVGRWEQAVDEMVRVLKPGGPIVMMHTGGGKEIPEINERYKGLCADAGYAIANIGAKDTQEVLDYLASKGRSIEAVSGGWEWNLKVSPVEAIAYIEKRQLSFARNVPGGVHSRACEELRHEYLGRKGQSKTIETVTNRIRLWISLPSD
jgi:ubiquinone/menaquinone biosynthesis C-methylase UbiE